MRKLLHSMTTVTAILSIAAPYPVYAQGEVADLPACGADIPLPCALGDGSVMTDERAAAEAQAAEAQAAADAAAAAQAEAEAQAAAAAQAEADAAAAAQAAADAEAAAEAQAQADAAAQAAADAQAASDAAAAAEAEAAAQAEAAAAADAAAKAEAEAQAAAQAEEDAAKAAADAIAAETQSEAEAAAQAEADAAAAAQAAVEAQAQAEADAATAAAAEATKASSDAAAVAGDAASTSAENADASSDAAATEAAAQAADEASEPAAEEVAPEAEAEVEAEAAVEAPAEEPAEPEAEAEAAPAEEPAAEAPAEPEATAEEAPAEPEATAETEATAEAEASAETPNAPAELVIDDPEVAAELKALQDEQAAASAEVEVAPEITQALSEAAAMPVCAEGVAYPCMAEDGTMMTEELAAIQAEAEAKAAEEAAAIAEQVATEPPPVVVENTEPTEDAGLTEETAAVEVANEEAVTTEVPVAVAAAAETEATADTPPTDMKMTATEVVTAENVRSSNEEFAKATAAEPGKKHRLTSLEKVLLIGLGAIVIGKIINDKGDKVVDNSGDRVTVQRPDGTYYVMRDDDALMRQNGNVVQTQTFNDGSTISIITKPNGEQVKTIRDSHGRVLRRTRVLPDGREFLLFDDTVVVEPIDVTVLPRESAGTVTLSSANDDALGSALQDALNDEISRRYSLSQVRNIRAVRELTPVLDIEQITFDSGSAAITPDEARKLAKLGLAMQKTLKRNPGAVFLIEGHTDATGSATLNLRLSDRRAESLALALTEYFNVPPENLVVQGYGEAYLKIPTVANERLNRRVAVRDITRLLGADEIALR